MKPDLRFPRRDRLKSRKSIDALFQSGKRISAGEFRAFYSFRSTPGLQIGVGSSSRQFKKAVDRNRIKRLIRESYRLNQHQWKEAMTARGAGMDLFVLFIGKQVPSFDACQQGMMQLLGKIFAS